MMVKLQRIFWVAALVFLAGRAAALPPRPSLDGVNNIPNGTVPTVRKTPGTVTATTTGNTLDIVSTSKRFVIDWTSFNIDYNNRVNFAMPDRGSIAVNRVTGVGGTYKSKIGGSLWSNGNVWLLNPNGVLITRDARIDVGGLLATPAGLSNIDEFITSSGTYAATSTINFVMPANPGAISTQGAGTGSSLTSSASEIMVRGGPAMFIVGSAESGKSLQFDGKIFGDTINGTGMLIPPSVEVGSSNTNTINTSTDAAEKASSHVLLAASGSFSLQIAEGALVEAGSPPNPLSSGDLELVAFTPQTGFVSGTSADKVIRVGDGVASGVASGYGDGIREVGQVQISAKASVDNFSGVSVFNPYAPIDKLVIESFGRVNMDIDGSQGQSTLTFAGTRVNPLNVGTPNTIVIATDTLGVCFGAVTGSTCVGSALNASNTSLTVSAFDNIRLGNVSTRNVAVVSKNSAIQVGEVLATAGDVRLESRTGIAIAGSVTSSVGSVRLNANAGQIETGNRDVAAGKSVDIQAGVNTASAVGEDPYVSDSGTFNVAVGNVTASNGTMLIVGRDGITTNAITQSRTTSTVPAVPEVDLQTKAGSVRATVVDSRGLVGQGNSAGAGGRLRVVAPGGIELGSARGSDVELMSQFGNVRIGTQSAQSNPGTVTATLGDVRASARSIEAGNISAARDLTLTASEGALTTGVLSATRNLSLSAANSLAVNTSAIGTLSGNVSLSSTAGSLCVGTRSGADCVAGDVIAGGTVNLVGRDGVTASNVRASGGNLSISAASGGVTVTGIEAAAATSAGRADVNVTARDNVQVRSRTVSERTVGGSVGAEGNVSISSAQGAITVDREIGASKGFAQLAAQTGVTTGNITSLTGFVDVQAKTGPVQVGDLYGLVGKPAPTTGPADPCAGNAICVQAGTGGTATSTTNYTVSTGTIRTDNTASGNVLVGGANGVQTGAIDINNGSVALNSSQGAINVGSVGLSGSSIGKSVVANARGKVTMGNITAGSGSIDLQSANDELVLARVSGGGDVRLRSAANLTVDLSKVDAGGVASFTSTGGELRVGTVSGSNFTPGDLNQTLGAVELSGQTGVTVGNVAARDGASLQSAAGSINAGEVVSSGGAVQVTAANDVNLRRAQGTAATIASNTGRIRVGTTSGSSFVGGNVNATTGAASVSARTGVEAADITGGTTATVNVAEGAVVARALFAGNGAAFVSGRDGVSVTSASAPKGSIDLIADRGAVKVGSTSGSTFSGGQVNAGRGGVGIDARDEIATGNVTASNWVKIGSESSKVSLGNVSASAAHSSDDECNGKSVCIGAAFDSANGSGQTLTVGSVTASAGDVLLFSRNGVTANGAVTVSRGELVVSGGSGAVTASGALTTGTGATTDANYGVKVDGASLALQNVTASGNIDLAANSTTGTITTGTLAARRNLTVQSIGGFAVGGDKIAGTPESVRLTSSAGSVCVGTVVDGRCTGSTLTRDTTLVIDGATGVTTGDLSVRSVNVSAAGGSATLGQVTTTGAVSVSARDALSARGVVATGSVRLASINDAVRVTETITSQQSSVTVAAKGLVETGNVTAGTFLDMQSRAGALKTGNLAARSAQTATTSATANTTNPCIGTAICIQTGTDSAAANPAALTASVGAVEAAAGNVRLDGRGGVEAGSVLANAGSVVFSSSDGGVRAATVRAAAPVSVVTASAATVASEVPRSTVAASVTSSSVEALAKGSIILGDVTSAGAVTLQSVEGSGGVTAGSIDAGTSAAVSAGQGTVTVAKVAAKSGNLKVVGKNAVKTGDVTGSAAVDLASESGTLESSAVNAGGVAKLAGASGVTVASIKGASVDAQSSGGGVTVGTGTGSSFVAGTVTATSGAVNVAASKDVIAGAIDAATSATVSAAQGAVTLANVAAKSGDLKIVGKNAVKTGDVTGSAGVELASDSSALDAGAVTAGGTAKLSGVSGIKLASIRGGAVDATSSAGSVAVTGGVTSTTAGVKLDGRDGVTSGAIDAATSATVTAAQGAVAVAAVNAGGALAVSGSNGVSVASARGGSVDMLASAGAIRVGTGTGSDFVAGSVTSTAGGVGLVGRDGVTAGAIDAATSVRLRADAGRVTVGRVRALNGLIDIASRDDGSSGELEASEDISVVSTNGNVRVGGAKSRAVVVTAARDVAVAGAVNAERGAAFTAGSRFANTAAVRVTNGTPGDGSGPSGFGGIDIRAADAEVGAELFVRGAGVNIRGTGAGGVVIGDGVTAPAGALQLSNAEVQRIDAGSLAIRSGPSTASGRDLVVGDLSLDRSKIPQLLLSTGKGGQVRVTGAVRGSGAPAVSIGESTVRPDGVEITGSLGATDAALGTVQIRSGADVLIGTQGFVDAAKAAADKTTFDVQSASVANAGTGNTRRLFLVAGATAFDAPGFILQQNTGTSGNNGDGLRIGVPSGDVTATFANGTAPRRIAVFGSVVDADGKALTSSSAAVAKGLLPANVTANDVWRLNTCIIGTGAACAATNLLPPPTQLVQPPVTPPPAAPATPSTQTSPTASTAPRATSTSSSSSGSSSSGSSSGSSSSGSSGSSGSDGSGSSGGSGASGSSDGGSSGSSDGSNGSSSDDQSASNDESAAEDESDTEDTQEQEPTEEEEQAANEEEATEEAAAQIADAGTQQEEESLKPLEVDAGSRDLLKPDTDGGIREPGVGSANEDLWPQEPLPTPPSTP